MSNPFLEPRTILVDQERKRRERFKVSVYVGLSAMTVFLLGLLIQGCQRSETPPTSSTTAADSALATNTTMPETTSTNTPPIAETKPEPTAPAALPVALSGSNPPAIVPAVAATPTPPATNDAPAPTPPPVVTPAPAEEVYVVKSGDNLTRIAKAHHTTVQAIKAANGLKTDRILAGQKLKLPAPTAAVGTGI